MTFRKILRDFALYSDGDALIGQVQSWEPPEIAVQTFDYRAGGLDMAIPIDMGQEPMECTFTLGGVDERVLRRTAVIGQETTLVGKGALVTQGGAVEQIVIAQTGKITGSNLGSWTPGEPAPATFTLRATYLRIEIAGTIEVEIDVLNQVRRIGDDDQLEAIRKAVGR